MLLLNKQIRFESNKAEIEVLPIKLLQIGEGNFLRGFADWMIAEAIKSNVFRGSIVVTQPRESGKKKIDELKAQNGLYTLVTRGIEQGKQIEKAEVIDVFQQVINPYEEWQTYLKLGHEPELRFVISNTTEAGLVYREEKWDMSQPIHSFPGKLTALLYERFQTFQGATDKGLICLPCELVERNGELLQALVLQYAQAWGLPDSFIEWIKESNKFLNSLVDRIVTGYPSEEQANSWFAQWGYTDKQLTTTEPYHLWAIEGDASIAQELPLDKAGLNVIWVDDLKPYQQRKVAILNGAHTSLALFGLLIGEQEVRLAMTNQQLSHHIKTMIKTEIIPTLPYEKVTLEDYAEQVYERFMNPFIQHRLSDIAMNSLSKFKTRLLPAIKYYLDLDGELPVGLLHVFSSFIRYYKVKKGDQGYFGVNLQNEFYSIRDDEKLLDWLLVVWQDYSNHNNMSMLIQTILNYEPYWGEKLGDGYPQLVEQLSVKLTEWSE